VLERIVADLKEVAVIEASARMEGRQMFMILAPTRRMLQSQRDKAKAAAAAATGTPAAPAAPRGRPGPSAGGNDTGGGTPSAAPQERKKMPKLKTKSAAKKRFQVKKSGAVKFRRAGARHLGHVREDAEQKRGLSRHCPPVGQRRKEDDGNFPYAR